MAGPIAGIFLLAALFAFNQQARAADPEPAAQPQNTASAGATNRPELSLSATAGAKRAPWQTRLTLGPGDLLNISLFEKPDTTQTDVPVGPDGRISFLEARGVMATGLTVDDLRAKLDEVLNTYYQNPRTLIVPSAFRSKKYFVLGAVAGRGVYSLDRPLTVIEAMARAGGLETGVYESKSVEMADLPHSFLVRRGERVPVDFERLFQQGDLSQNAALEPDDYLYFASANGNEIYVLGEVALPGIVAFSPRLSVIGAITGRGGFTTRAFKSRVLVVRGSFNHPQTFVVDTAAILAAKAPDFKLQPKDIVFVNANPWVMAGEVVDLAARAFLQGLMVEWATTKVGPIITSPLIK